MLVKTSLMEYFKNAVEKAISELHVKVNELTAFYIVNLLTVFFRTERVYIGAEDLRYKTIAQVFLESKFYDITRRIKALKHIADYSLFMSGFFSESFKRKLVSIDYFITLGSKAYLDLASILVDMREKTLVDVYRELGEKFPILVDVLAEVSEKAIQRRNDLLQVYEKWLRTHSQREEKKLRKCGIYPLNIDFTKLQ